MMSTPLQYAVKWTKRDAFEIKFYCMVSECLERLYSYSVKLLFTFTHLAYTKWVRDSYIRTTHSYSYVQCKVCTNQSYRKSTPDRHIISMWPHDDGGYMDFTIFVVCWQHTYSTVEKSWANFHSFLIFCFQGARRSCNFLTWSWAIVLHSFWSVFSFFSVFLFFYPCIFRWPVHFLHLLIHLTLTYKLFKHKRGK